MLKIVVASGFGQHDGIWNGNYEVKEIAKQEFDNESRLQVDIQLYPWNSDWRGIAQQFHLERLRYKLPRDQFIVIVFAYSYGVGNGLVNFAKALKRFGIDVTCAVICDGIYHHWNHVGWWRALYGGSWFATIKIPDNVKEVRGFYQRVSRPMGMKPETQNLSLWTELTYPHTWCDDAPEWHLECIEVAKRFVRRAKSSPTTAAAEAPASVAELESKIVIQDAKANTDAQMEKLQETLNKRKQ